jgi:hypothetical protein
MVNVAIQNPFAGQAVAETELSRRIYRAALNLGWNATEAHTAADIKAFQPDFVIALHNDSPKLADYPTYGCMWNPLSFFEGTQTFVQHVLTYDGYLTSSPAVERWLHQILHTTPKQFFTAPFYTSCSATEYQPPQLETPCLAYLGSNWDGDRFRELFEALDHQPFMRVYGKADGWTYLTQSYQGSLPYDGVSVLKTLNQAGIGLCLHRAEHRHTALPSMRIFEIVASGAIALCGEHPFIREAFGDSVLYLDPDASADDQLQQITEHMSWIRHHPNDALAMSKQAHAIFQERYALETLLQTILPHHERLVAQKGFALAAPSPSQQPSVEFILCVESGQPDLLNQVRSQLTMIQQQTYPNVGVILVKPQATDLDLVHHDDGDRLSIRVVNCPESTYHSTAIWAGLNAVEADYCGLLSATGSLYRNHIHTLVSVLDSHPDCGVAYAGVGLSHSPPHTDASTPPLAYFQPFNLDQVLMFDPPIAPHGLLMRRSLFDAVMLQDPQLNQASWLCLLLHLAQRSPFAFSYELTCDTTTPPPVEHSQLQLSRDWASDLSRLRFIFWHQEFAPGKTLQTLHEAHLAQERDRAKLDHLRHLLQEERERSHQQLQAAQTTIAAMETSKFWQLRTAWFRLKRAIGWPSE